MPWFKPSLQLWQPCWAPHIPSWSDRDIRVHWSLLNPGPIKFQLKNNPLVYVHCTPPCLLSNVLGRRRLVRYEKYRASLVYLPLYVGGSNSDCKEWTRENGSSGVAGAGDRAGKEGGRGTNTIWRLGRRDDELDWLLYDCTAQHLVVVENHCDALYLLIPLRRSTIVMRCIY